jgi:hypothetical protein
MWEFVINLFSSIVYGGRRTPRQSDRLAIDHCLRLLRPDYRLIVERQVEATDLWQTRPDGRLTVLYSSGMPKDDWPKDILLPEVHAMEQIRSGWPSTSATLDCGEHLFCSIQFIDRYSPEQYYVADVYFYRGRIFNIAWTINPDHIANDDMLIVKACTNPLSPYCRSR